MVILDEPVSVDREVPVSVEIPDDAVPDHKVNGITPKRNRQFQWGLPRPTTDTYQGSVADEVVRQRREE